MNATAVPAVSCPSIEDETMTLRQWACFPQNVERLGLVASPQIFRLLVESSGRRLAIATVALRMLPDAVLAADLACLIDERPFEFASRERIVGEFATRHGVVLDLLDVDLDQDDPLKLTSAIPRAVAQAAIQAGKPGPGAVSLSALRTSVTERLTAEWLATRSQFISGLDPEAVAQARAIDGLRPSSYSYLNTVNAVIRRNRAQAMAVFPLLRPVLMTPQLNSVRKDIDEGRPLIDVLALHYQTSKAMIRVLCGVTPEDLDHRIGQLGTLVKLLHEIPPSWWPRDPATWRQFASAANAIARVSRHPITTATNQLWLRRSAQTGYQISENTPEDLARLGQDIDEFMDTLRRALYWTLPDPRNLCTHMPVKRPLEIAAALKANVGLEKLGQIVRRFGDAYRNAVTEFAEQAELWRGVRWPALGDGDGVREYGEIVIRPLLTPTDLTDEGARMGNCVASYVEHCMKGTSQIWSVRLQDETCGYLHLSTLETRIRTHPNGRKILDVQQHKGIGNGSPAAMAWQAVRAHAAYFSESPRLMQAYLDWKTTISRKPLEVRQRHALMLPIVTALEKSLPRQWSWQRLITMGTPLPKEAATRSI
ncbi:MAG: PcfJ domain-containing protein [Rhodocyclales bacterium]|nr:PcfJ domain-containing protein [Rhodocyclales bacterium]